MNTGEFNEQRTHGVEIIVALIGALATIVAALIAILPNLIRKRAAPPILPDLPPPASSVAQMNDCVGKWRWRTSDRSIEFDLRGDGSFTAKNVPDAGRLVDFADGRGNWEVVSGRLTVTMTHVGKFFLWEWCGLWKSYKVEWISNDRITAVSRDEITLKASKPLRRM